MESTADTGLSRKLAQYLEKLPEPTLLKLAYGLEREKLRGTKGLPFDELISALRPLLATVGGERPGLPDPMRHFCQPFEDLLVTDGVRPRRGQISRSAIALVWAWLENDLLPDALPDLCRHVTEKTLEGDKAGLEAAVSVMHESASRAMLAEIERARKDTAYCRELERRLSGEEGLDDARKIADVLAIAPAMIKLQKMLPKPIENLDETMVKQVRELYDEVSEEAPERAIYIAYGVAGRLREPHQVLRLARRIAHQRNDILISRTELAVLGEDILSEMETIAAEAEAARPGRTDLEKLLEDVKRFTRLSKGLTTEIDLRRCGEWGQRLLGARAKFSVALAEELSRIELILVRALPLQQMGVYGRGAPQRPDIADAPSKERSDKAIAAVHFLHGITPYAEAVGAQSHCCSVSKQVTAYLDAYEDRLLEELRLSDGEQREHASLYLELVAHFREELGYTDQADILRRRGLAAAQG